MAGSINSVYHNASWAMANHSKELYRIQEQTATGSKINRPSDDPSNSNRLLDLISEDRSLDGYLSAVATISSRFELASSIVQTVTETIGGLEARITSLLSGVQGGETAEATRLSVAQEFNDALEQFLSLANTARADHYLFGGADSSEPPYVAVRNDAGEIIRVDYQGNYDQRKVVVVPGVEMPSVLVGEEVFRSDMREVPEFTGPTGAAAGTGTASVRGTVILNVNQTAPNTYELSIDDDPANITTVTVPPGDLNTMVQNSQGEVLYVDTTALSGSGQEMVTVGGTYDLFNAMISVRDLLRNDIGLPDQQLLNKISDAADDLASVDQTLVRSFTKVGGRIGALENLKNSMEDLKLQIGDEQSRLQDADIAQLAVDLSEREVLYQMSMNISAKLFSLSILDYL